MSRFARCGMFCTALLAMSAIGCGSEDAAPAEQPERVEFLTFWQEGAELAALEELINIHTARRPNAEIITTFEPNGSYQDRLTQRMAEQNPPDTFQSNMGQRLLIRQANLEPVRRGNWSMPEELLEVNSVGEDLYAVPISLIRQSSFYYNPALFTQDEIDAMNVPGKAGVDALLAACARIQEEEGIQPFSLGNVYNWTLDMMFWEALFPAIVGPEYYQAFWKGEADPANDPQLDEALSYLLELSQYFNADSAEIDFPEALDNIAEGEAACGQQGDWGTGMLAAKFELGVEFDVMPFPGTSDLFIFSQDVLPIVAGTPNRAATQELLNTIATEELQIEFNRIKGQLPALTGMDVSSLNSAQQAVYAHFDNAAARIPVVHGYKPDDVMKDLSAIEKTMIETQDTEELKTYLTANYGLLGD